MKEMFFRDNLHEKMNGKIQNSNLGEKIIYRIISFNDIYFFAEEIATGTIFPVYKIWINRNNENHFAIKEVSYVQNWQYGLYIPLDRASNNLNFKYSLDNEDEVVGMPTIDEVNAYLKEKNRNKKRWQKTLKDYEECNKYFCDISVIKEKIAMLKNSRQDFELYIDNSSVKYVNYTPKIDLSEIKDFGYDLSKQYELCDLIGREKELKEIIKTIAIKNKSILLLGESGSGKTSIVEKLALDIRNDSCEWLEDKIIFSLSIGSLIAGTSYRGAFEDKIKKLIEFCKKNRGSIIVFIDEIHMLYGLGVSNEQSVDAMNLLKPYISNGDITIIGATTNKEYEKYMVKDEAFLRRFDVLDISLPDRNLIIEILISYITYLENKYRIQLNLSEEEKYQVVEYLTDITDTKNQRVVGMVKKENPTLSKNILEDAFTEAIYSGKDTVTAEEIIYAIIECKYLSPSFRIARGEELKKSLERVPAPKTKILSLV